MSDDEIDVLAIQRDDELLDALGARQPIPAFAGDDLVAGLLAALTDEVDEGVGPPLPSFQVLVRSSVQEVPRARRVGRRTVIGLGVAGVLFSASGVAAAVTGDPFAPIKKVVTAVTDSPQRSTRDQVEQELKQVDEAIDRGDPQEAAEQLAEAREKAKSLGGAEAVAAMEQVKRLEAKLGVQSPTPTGDGTPSAEAVLPSPSPSATDTPTKSAKELREEERQRQREERQRLREERRREREQSSASPTPAVTPLPSPSALQLPSAEYPATDL